MSQGESQWVMNALNQLEARVDARFDRLDDRLRGVENKISWLWGGFAAVTALLTLLLVLTRILDISISLG